MVEGPTGVLHEIHHSGPHRSGHWTCHYYAVMGEVVPVFPEVGIGPPITPQPGQTVGLVCLDENGAVARESIFVFDPANPVPGLDDPAEAAALALERLPLRPPAIAMNPPAGVAQLVGVTTWLWIADPWVPLRASATLDGVTSTVSATPISVAWTAAGGPSVTCHGPGVPYDTRRPPEVQHSDCTALFEVAGTFALTATVTYSTAWTATTGDAGVLPPGDANRDRPDRRQPGPSPDPLRPGHTNAAANRHTTGGHLPPRCPATPTRRQIATPQVVICRRDARHTTRRNRHTTLPPRCPAHQRGGPIASSGMKIRIGFGLGTRTVTNDGETFGAFVDDLERLGFDSLWLSERISGEAPDPLIALSYAAARTTKLKLGMSVLVLPGRNPVLLAEELATLDRLSDGRLLPAFGLGVADPHEQQAFGVERGDRAKIFNESLPLLRRLWTEDAVDHDGTWFHYEGITVRPRPVQEPLELWLGGIAPSELKRVGRLGDGWLPSFCTPADVAAGIPVIVETADAHDRQVDPEHYGALVAYAEGAVPDVLAKILAQRRPDLADPSELIPVGLTALRTTIESMVEAGASKFVVLPLSEPSAEGWTAELEGVAAALKPLEN